MSSNAKLNPVILWLLTVLLTLGSVIYQRMTGPTHPMRGSVEISNQKISYKLLRSHDTTADAEVKVHVGSEAISGMFDYRRYKSHDEWHSQIIPKTGDELIFAIPKQPSAGKVMYNITLLDESGAKYPLNDEPVIIRFKDPVPGFVLYPHILFMFTAMLLACRAGLEALFTKNNLWKLSLATAVAFFIGGIILGPIVQKYAFDAYWTGWPWGHDLTDNKTAAAVIAWVLALWRIRKTGGGKGWVIAASIITLLVYLIPHSVLGSEIDYTQTTN